LVPFIEEEKASSGESGPAGRVLMATVKGDVHDIGKNIVGVVLGCNNFEVIDLGVMVSCNTILDKAVEHGVDVIGLSGLITPSLDEMVFVASEMERRGMTLPLLIGGATTSRMHTAVKIAPAYSVTVVHVLDASRSVPVVQNRVTDTNRKNFTEDVKTEYARLREEHANRQSAKQYLPYQKAVENGAAQDWSNYLPPVPKKVGITEFRNFPLSELVPYIDWTPFFQTWELHGRYPEILKDAVVGEEATKLFADAQELLQELVTGGRLKAHGVVGIWPASRVGGDSVSVFDATNAGKVLANLEFLRQQAQKASGVPNYSLADWIAPQESGLQDYLGAFAVTAGEGLDELVAEFEKDHDDYRSIMAKALADRLAEAFAECLHEKVRKEVWGYAMDESLDNESLIKEKYRGIRPAPGYPAFRTILKKDCCLGYWTPPNGLGSR